MTKAVDNTARSFMRWDGKCMCGKVPYTAADAELKAEAMAVENGHKMKVVPCSIPGNPWKHIAHKNKVKNLKAKEEREKRKRRTDDALRKLRAVYGPPLNEPEKAEDERPVWYAAGTAYHRSRYCTRLQAGRRLAAGGVSTRPTVRSTPREAARLGKLPCTHCKPYPVFPPLNGEDFGHKPILGFIDGRGLVKVCARCYIPCNEQHVACYDGGLRVMWPCMTARILGIGPVPTPRRNSAE